MTTLKQLSQKVKTPTLINIFVGGDIPTDRNYSCSADAIELIHDFVKLIIPNAVTMLIDQDIIIDGFKITEHGSGIKNLASIASILYHAQDVAYIELIESSLHPSVIAEVVDKIYEYCKENQITLFTSTHNNIVWQAFLCCVPLKKVGEEWERTTNDITLHRIERGKKNWITFDTEGLQIAAKRDIYVL